MHGSTDDAEIGFDVRDSFQQILYVLKLLGCCWAAVTCCTQLSLQRTFLVLDLVFVRSFSLEGLHEACEEAAPLSIWKSPCVVTMTLLPVSGHPSATRRDTPVNSRSLLRQSSATIL